MFYYLNGSGSWGKARLTAFAFSSTSHKGGGLDNLDSLDKVDGYIVIYCIVIVLNGQLGHIIIRKSNK